MADRPRLSLIAGSAEQEAAADVPFANLPNFSELMHTTFGGLFAEIAHLVDQGELTVARQRAAMFAEDWRYHKLPLQAGYFDADDEP